MLKFSVSVFLLLFVSMVANAKQVERIIALSPHSVEILFLLGVGDKIVGTVDFADYPEEAKSIPRIGGHTAIQIDRVLELEPDIVIAWESGNPTRDIERIKELGIVVYESTTKELEDIPQEILRIGDKVGRSAEAQVQAQNYRERLDSLRDNYQSRKPVSFFYQLWSKPLRTMAAGSWINQMFAGCGAVNVFDDPSMDYPQVSLESVIDLRPEVIVVPTHHGTEMDLNMWNDWPEIPAVKNDHIVFFNGDLLHRFSYRTLYGMQQICEVFDDIRQSKK
ncbi:hypothetical protein A3715_14255 [Oleiphilus sp. HI0009]|uniref:cobalamin-binding protein n=1 Tax=unclassified Oleiphilus TaxID=2631174 RepID=UPI0007C36272|nr:MULTISPECIES: cobalamin-binding protein [unclassified Oleiphilus]KZX75552.1 hypothetical protein A3715_14255 [Oleiphilus sp. HI0009]MCH2159175.1 cobalamin-binding protein [Oleiphilaceae bacterium]KZY64022.1 hypothetical protein A3738_19845 [Oleiphilus sp. HI0066]KZY68859.1 hypothetical protein A3739_10275 [Oleiphilus sp. HI0067]KZY69443.1 hypothetical protein A3738_04395 [Oleiphilus sp. HI0066]